ncbi:MAG: hypothetical protein K6G38_06335 [Gammaproteobacteria bacterium]|nr:hypothetical protein [Gammaproteobacteria bacterium]
MSSIQKVRTYVYDTPATYDQFNGGINTNLSNEALEANELRDGLNCHYVNQSLMNRKGEKLLKKLNLPINSRPQGDFMFSAEHNDYIISVRNGHIFYGIFEPTVQEINMTLLLIDIPEIQARDDCGNYLIDVREETSIDLTQDTEGFIYRYYAGNNTDPGYVPSEDEYRRTLIIQNTKRVQGIPAKLKTKNAQGKLEEHVFFIMATGLRILRVSEEYDADGDRYYLFGHVMEAYAPNSWEIQNIGVNNFSPFPNFLIDETVNVPKTLIGQIQTTPKELAANNISSNIIATAKLNTMYGYEKEDLYYKWEARIGANSEWVVLSWWKNTLNTGNASSKGKHTITITPSQLNTLKTLSGGSGTPVAGDDLYIRCTVTSDFQVNYDLPTKTYSKDLGDPELGIDGNTHEDFVADIAVAQYSKTHIVKRIRALYHPEYTLQYCYSQGWNDQATRLAHGFAEPDDQFLKMHSCTKVVSDGSKLLFYDDAYDSCEWYKTVVGQINYLSYGGNLNFRTSKNEKLIGVVVFDSNIVVFSDNETLGGNISVVTGNGDDYNDGDYYSPYKRSIVNTSVSCDAYNTIQVAENYIIFKYRRDIYMLDTNDLDGERVQVVTINDKVKQRLNNVEFPLDRIREPKSNEDIEHDFHEYSKCLKPDEIFSEVCDGYYGIIFPRQGFHYDTFEYPENALKQYEGANQEYIEKLRGRKIENISVKPGLRWKCYFRNGQIYEGSSKTFFPWLRDVSPYLNIVSVIDINGESSMITDTGLIIQFNDYEYKGMEENNYKVRMTTRCYDMDLPTLCKFMDNLNVYYNRDFSENLYCDMFVKNEASYYIYTPNTEAYINMQEHIGGEVKFDERYKIDDALNLLPGYEPLEQYDTVPYLDPMDKPVQILNETPLDTAVLDRPSFTSTTLTPKYRFPFLSAQFILEMKSNQAFSLSSLTFSYTSHDMPDFTREKLYREILKGNILK